MDKYYMSFSDQCPKYIQIANNIRELIEQEILSDGEKLPSIRELAQILNVNKDTIIAAYKLLAQEGAVVQVLGSGSYAKKKEIIKSFKKEYRETFKKLTSGGLKHWIDFTGETTTANFVPVNNLKKAINEVLDRDGAEALIYQDVMGYEKLRNSINNRFWNGQISLDNILIVSGAQQGIDIISKSLINVNDNVIIEKPTYMGALNVFRCRKANILEVPMESDGVNIKIFEKLLKRYKIKCFYMMSYFQNPTGISYSKEKKEKLLELSLKYNFYIIEDDYLSELIYDNNIEYCPLKRMDDNNRVIYIKSFSKIFLPGIRMGYIITPEEFRESFQISKSNTDISTSSLMQRALEVYINKEYWTSHIEFISNEYYSRYAIMKNMLENKLNGLVDFIDPKGGLSFYVTIKPEVNKNSLKLFYSLKEKNIFITPGIMFYKNSKDGENTFRLGFSQASSEEIEEGLENIYEVLRGR